MRKIATSARAPRRKKEAEEKTAAENSARGKKKIMFSRRETVEKEDETFQWKKIKGNATKAMTEEFVMEAKLMRELIHPNIVTVFGVAPSEEPLMIVLELAANGCLKSYVAKYNCPMDQLTQFTTDAACIMAYLSSKTVIWPLAICYLAPPVKISDFSLSSAGKEEIKITKAKLPIRWLAPLTPSEASTPISSKS